jgi:PIN domain nuclease of toxin-antitoxin system
MSRYLLDTQVWLWLGTAPERIRAAALEVLEDENNEILLSAVSSWEISIKYGLGKLSLPVPPHEYVPERIRLSGVTPIGVEHAEALAVAELPLHHRDPFDRLLIVQSRGLAAPLVTSDAVFARYDVELLSA